MAAFLLLGQSNMVGRGDPSDLPEQVRGELLGPLKGRIKIAFWNESHREEFGIKSDGWIDLEPECQISKFSNSPHFGPEMTIATALVRNGWISLEHSETTPLIYLIKFGMGSTGIQDWHSSSPHFSNMISFCKQQLNAAKVSNLSGVFWMQGETDSSNSKHANAYSENIREFVTDIRREFQNSSLPFVASQVLWRAKKLAVVNQALMELASNENLGGCGCASNEGFMVDDTGHLDASSLVLAGERVAKVFVEKFPAQSVEDSGRD
eukprot:c2710_g1_i1.p1 GENE.c2710_g1_i1~~c2710_g1_i1.p1  ORF type:complete len:265 (+),score=61.71 c2710_g1_i1:73-867(+)